MKKVFISYSPKDDWSRNVSWILTDQLLELGVKTETTVNENNLGSNWQKSITDQINECSIFVCFLERANPNLMFELGYALAKNKNIIVIGELEELPNDVRTMNYLPRETNPNNILSQIENILKEKSNDSTLMMDFSSSKQAIKLLLDRPELLDSIGSLKFEDLIKDWFDLKGYQVESPNISRNYGYDFSIYPFRKSKALVEVKKYKSTSKVPLEVIRQLVGTMTIEQTPIGIIVSSAPFSKSARFFIQEMNLTILLWTLEDLEKMTHQDKSVIENTKMEY